MEPLLASQHRGFIFQRVLFAQSGGRLGERCGKVLGDRSGESLLEGKIAARLRVLFFKLVLFAQSGERLGERSWSVGDSVDVGVGVGVSVGVGEV